MAKMWDDLMKRLFGANPQAVVDWLVPGATFQAMESLELKSRTFQVDMLSRLQWQDQPMGLHVEAQRRSDPEMGKRLWEYNTTATILLGYPVDSVVIYLRKDRKVQEPPYVMDLPTQRVNHVFYYRVILLWEVPAEVLKQPGLEGLLPLLPLAKDGDRPEVVEEMITGLVASQKTDLLSIAYMFAALVFDKQDEREWLIRRFEMLKEVLEESWAYQKILREGLEEGREQGLAEGREQGREQGREEALHQMLLMLMEVHFPQQIALARQQTAGITDPMVLQSIIARMFVLQTSQEAEQYLLALDSDANQH